MTDVLLMQVPVETSSLYDTTNTTTNYPNMNLYVRVFFWVGVNACVCLCVCVCQNVFKRAVALWDISAWWILTLREDQDGQLVLTGHMFSQPVTHKRA